MSVDLIKNCNIALLPQCEAYKNKEDRNTGFSPLYNGLGVAEKITGTMTNMASSYGYYWDGSEWVYRFDGVDDVVGINNLNFELTDTKQFTFIARVNPDVLGSNMAIMGSQPISNERFYIFIGSTGNVNAWFRIGGTYMLAVATTATVTAGVFNNISVSVGSSSVSIGVNGVYQSFSKTITSNTYNHSTFYIASLGTSVYFGGKCSQLILYEDITLTDSQCDDIFALSPSFDGLRGIPYSDGTMSFLEERSGLYDSHKNVTSLISSSIPRASDFNTGLIPLVQGESAVSTITATLTNFGSGYGFIAESGGVPAHVLFDGVDDGAVTNYTIPLSDTSSFTFRAKFRLGALAQFGVLFGQIDGDGRYVYGSVYTSNQLFMVISDGTLTCIVEGVSTLSLGVDYDACFVKSGNTVKLFLNGVEEAYVTQNTYTLGTINVLNPMIIGELSGNSNFNGRIYDLIAYNDAKTSAWIKEQYYSSQNEWQQDLVGAEPDTPDGTMSLSAEHEYIDAQQCWLEYDSFAPVAHTWNTGRKGRWKRQPAIGFVDEILARWDLSNYSGELLNSVRLLSYSDAQGAQPASATSTVYEQDKKIAANWANGTAGPPIFDDFAVSTAWATVLDTLSVQDSGKVYEYLDSSNNIRDLIQDMIDGVKDQDDGLIIDADFQAATYYLDVFNIKLGIKLADSNFNHLHYIGRGVGVGVFVGIG